MSPQSARELAKERVIETYKRTRRIKAAAEAGPVPYSTATDWLIRAELIASSRGLTIKPYGFSRASGRTPDAERLARVDRDPCPRCNTRKDIGCKHFPLQADPERPLSAREQADAMWSAGA